MSYEFHTFLAQLDSCTRIPYAWVSGFSHDLSTTSASRWREASTTAQPAASTTQPPPNVALPKGTLLTMLALLPHTTQQIHSHSDSHASNARIQHVVTANRYPLLWEPVLKFNALEKAENFFIFFVRSQNPQVGIMPRCTFGAGVLRELLAQCHHHMGSASYCFHLQQNMSHIEHFGNLTWKNFLIFILIYEVKRRQHCMLLKMTVLAEMQSISPPDN